MKHIALGVLLLAVAAPASASSVCPPGSKPYMSWIEDDKKAYVDTQIPDLAEKAARDTPRAAASSKQQSAPSITGVAATLIDSAGFSELLGAAFDRNVGNKSTDAITLNFNPFTLAAIGNPNVYYDQQQYQKREYELLRRIGGTVSFGGKGDAFDRDGDGKVDDALESQNLDDIVGWEFRARVWGSRDRRDPDNFKVFTDSIANVRDASFVALESAQGDLILYTQQYLGVEKDKDNLLCLTDGQWKELRARPDFAAKYDSVLSLATKLNKAYAAAADEIDNRMLWTIAATGLERKKEFGPDKHGVSIRGTWRAVSFNFDWMNVSSFDKTHESNDFKVGAKYATQILKGVYWTDGLDASASFAYEKFDHVANAKHDDNLQFQGTLAIPVMDGVTIPFSIRWANHRDLFSDKDQVIGNFGINIDTSKLLDTSIARRMIGST